MMTQNQNTKSPVEHTGPVEKGFIQLVSADGAVLAQRESTNNHIQYHREKVWHVPLGGDVVFTTSSKYVQPYGFNLISDLNSIVDFYRGNDVGVDGQCPPDTLKTNSVIASELSGNPDISAIAGDSFWVAYIEGQWAGCSEY